jgi:AcrR family transcriptional regulator
MKARAESRRRGNVLEKAILQAAWDELIESGYARFTVENVAVRASTSRTVLNRRWTSKSELAEAAIKNYFDENPIVVPDLGNVREEIAFSMKELSDRAGLICNVLMLSMSEYFAETHSSLSDLRRRITSGSVSILEPVLERAVARREIDAAKLTRRIASLPFDLLRHDVLMTFKPMSRKAIYEIIDEVFLPLVASRAR